MTAGDWTPTAAAFCGYCGGYHAGMCPRIKAIEWYPNGTVKLVELHSTLSTHSTDAPIIIRHNDQSTPPPSSND